MTIDDAREEFLRHCETRQLSPHTLRAYQLDLQRFTVWIGKEVPIGDVDRIRIHDYAEALFAAFGLHPSSAKRHIASLKALFHYLEEQGLIDDPFRRAKIKIKLPERLPRILTRPELRALLTQTPACFETLTTQVAVEILFTTGIRVSELASLRDDEVDLEGKVITITGKGNRQRRVYLADEDVVGMLREYREQRGTHTTQDRFLVTKRGTPASPETIRRLVRNHASLAKLTRRVTPHMFRHSCATYLLEEGMDIRYVQRLLGHRSITTTEIYTHVSDNALKAHLQERQPRRAILAASVPGR